jgi:hypothetical protein
MADSLFASSGQPGAKGDKGDKGDTGATGPTGPTGPAGTISSNFRTRIAALAPTRWYQCTNAGSSTTETDHGSDGQDGTWSSSGASTARGIIIGQTGTATLLDGTAGRLDMPTTGLPTGAGTWSVVHLFTLYDKSAGGVHSAWGLGAAGTASHNSVGLDWSSSLIEANNNPGFFTVGWQDVAMVNGMGTYLATMTYDATTLRVYLFGRFIFSAASALNLSYGSGAKASIGSTGDSTPAQFSKIITADWFLTSGTVLTAAQIYDLYAAWQGN